MKKLSYPRSGRLTQMLAGVALAALAVHAQAAPTDTRTDRPEGTAMRTGTTSDVSEPGTIPAARPGLPQIQRGAEGPLRGDEYSRKADPSIRDTHPLTVNGLWETQPGNRIAPPHP
ncbi:MAG: hypothetical protein WAZ34_07660 [Rhodocyclaceae bacterium]